MEDQQTNVLDAETAPPAVRRLVIGKTQANVSTGNPIQLSWKVPIGYKKCTGVYFNSDPGSEIIFNLYSENVVYNIVQGFSTAVGTALGFMNPQHEYAEKDQISLTGVAQNISGGPKSITVSLQFE